MKYIAVIQARMQSSRLPRKVLRDLCGEPVLWRIIERVQRCRRINGLIVATTANNADNEIALLCRDKNIPCFRGSEEDVLSRFIQAFESVSEFSDEDCIVRLTADDPFKDPDVIDEAIGLMENGDYDYVSNTITPSYPEGVDVEIVRVSALRQADREAALPSEREHVTPFIWKQPQRFRLHNFSRTPDLSFMRWTLDTPEDWAFVQAVYEVLYPQNPQFTMQDILYLMESQPDIADKMNRHVERNAGYKASFAREENI